MRRTSFQGAKVKGPAHGFRWPDVSNAASYSRIRGPLTTQVPEIASVSATLGRSVAQPAAVPSRSQRNLSLLEGVALPPEESGPGRTPIVDGDDQVGHAREEGLTVRGRHG